MSTFIRPGVSLLLLLTCLGGCSAAGQFATSAQQIIAAIVPPPRPAAPVLPPSPTLDAYKTEVAQHVMRHNPGHTFSGQLPPMLPAIVVLRITVGADGQLQDVAVQRSRDADASNVALASIRRSGPLPRPNMLLAAPLHALTFSETFLFDHQYRFQLRSLAGPQ
jgi:protein TonB